MIKNSTTTGDNPAALEPEEIKKSLQQLQSRTQTHIDPGIAFERLRQAHPLFQTAESRQTSHFNNALQHPHHHAFTQLQQQQAQQNQPLNHQNQPKSFTIDAILGLRGNSQREKHQRYHPYRKRPGL